MTNRTDTGTDGSGANDAGDPAGLPNPGGCAGLPDRADPAAVLEDALAGTLPQRRGLEAWRALLVAQATLIRQLDVELQESTGFALADFDVLAQLAGAHGSLRMTQLADRALISRSGMTRRVARLVDEGLVERCNVEGDGRAVGVSLTPAGLARLAETSRVHVRGVAQHFVGKLDDRELALLESALGKVALDCSFG